jgi:hypothetical protein
MDFPTVRGYAEIEKLFNHKRGKEIIHHDWSGLAEGNGKVRAREDFGEWPFVEDGADGLGWRSLSAERHKLDLLTKSGARESVI